MTLDAIADQIVGLLTAAGRTPNRDLLMTELEHKRDTLVEVMEVTPEAAEQEYFTENTAQQLAESILRHAMVLGV